MVRVVEKSLEERAREEKHQQLVAIAKEVITTPLSITNLLDICIHDRSADPVISVDSSEHMIRVWKPEYFDIAMRLATTYEERVKGKEFTVKKQY
ncbi:MAG: hypothetical protein Q8L34_06425 [Candidatus Woesearchaeota archaeon]|nr:hypothetical protein [Candidatus Woesearchaeota archaeon]